MSDQNKQSATEGKTELDVLKDRARLMGITFSNNIGIDSLRARIEEKLAAEGASEDRASEDEAEDEDVIDSDEEPVNALEATAAIADAKDTVPHGGNRPKKKLNLRQKLIRENMRLIRCRITNLDPKKKDLPGEVLTVANSFIGTVRKFVPFGEATEDGYHIPYVLYKMMKKRRFLHIRTVRDRHTGTSTVKTSYEREFAIEVLPPLTEEELQRLAMAQTAAGSLAE